MGLLEKDKRKFRVIIGSKKCGMCYGTSPSLAAKKVKEKSGAFYLKEMTKDSKKKLYGPYSSKKGVVQRGGEFKNPLRGQICEDILAILKKCHEPDKLTETQRDYNGTFNVLERSYILLGINHRKDKCVCLRNIIGNRDSYRYHSESCSLMVCLCNLTPEEQQLREFAFFNEHSDLILQYINHLNKHNYYESHWTKFINFIRRTINLIEIEIRERDKNSNARLAQLKKEFNKEKEEANNALFNKMRSEITAAKAAAEESNSNSNNEAIAALRQTMSEQPNSLQKNTGATAGPAEANPSRNNESKSLLNNPLLGIKHLGQRNVKRNNQQPASTNNLKARLAALLNND